jgi:hypothetical protein
MFKGLEAPPQILHTLLAACDHLIIASFLVEMVVVISPDMTHNFPTSACFWPRRYSAHIGTIYEEMQIDSFSSLCSN